MTLQVWTKMKEGLPDLKQKHSLRVVVAVAEAVVAVAVAIPVPIQVLVAVPVRDVVLRVVVKEADRVLVVEEDKFNADPVFPG